jgi:hypothetical protein
VTELHETASRRTEKLLRRLGSKAGSTTTRTDSDPPPSAIERKAVALFSFGSEFSSDISFEKGDILTILESAENLNTRGWWSARLGAKTGIIPANYVRIVDDDFDSPKLDTQTKDKETAEMKSEPDEPDKTPLSKTDAKASVGLTKFDQWKLKFDNWRRERKKGRVDERGD